MFDIIVSLTICKAKINSKELKQNIFNLLAKQKTQYKYKVILYLNEEEFQIKKEIPSWIIELDTINNNFELLWIHKNIKELSINPIIEKYPNLPIICINDTEQINSNIIEIFMNYYKQNSNIILSKYGINEIYNNNIKLYVAYHKPELKNKLRKKVFDVLYDTTLNINEDNLNNLHDFFGEFTQMYYVWKNNKYSPYIGFSNWRKQIEMPQKLNNLFTPQNKVYEKRTLKGGFIFSHGELLYNEMITSIKKLYGENSKYLNPFNETIFYMGGHGIYKWDFFTKCMDFTWKIMNDIIIRNNLKTYDDYVIFSNNMLKKREDWCHPDQKQDHQYLFFGYIFERLITVFIVANEGEK